MLTMKASDLELELITNQMSDEDSSDLDPQDEADLWMTRYLKQFYDQDDSAWR